jgi:hypothetical protein
MYVIIKVDNYLQAIKKVELSSSNFFALYATSVRFDSNGVKLQV